MTAFDETVEALAALAKQCSGLYEDAVRRHGPEVDAIIRSGSRDVKRIERTLDGLLDFGDDGACLRLYKRLCRHYWTIDPAATAEYVMIYRKIWDSEPAPQPESAP